MLKTTILQRLLMLLLLTAGGSKAWGDTGNAVVKMTWVDYNNPSTSHGEIASGSTAQAGYNAIGTQDGYPYVNFGNTGWGCNWITFIEVNASSFKGRITNVTLSFDVSGSSDSKRETTWGVGYNFETWRSDWTFNTADRHFIQLPGGYTTETKLSSTFERATFDITNALKNDADHVVNIVVYETVAGGGYIKNPQATVTYETGWSVEEFSMDFTSINFDNTPSVTLPRLYDTSGNDITSSATFNITGGVVGDLFTTTYPPQMRQTGNATVTATYGGNDYSYTLHVTGSTVSGTYDQANNKYSFDQTGIITQRTFTDVEGVTMTINGGPTALVVNATIDNVTYKALKVIDANGYSQPNLSNNVVVPWEGNYGGTFYKFVPSVDGTIYFEGHFRAATWVKDGAVANSNLYSTKQFAVLAGSTYYLYNTNAANAPLLHSYRFVPTPSAGTLKFRNPSSSISVDLSEGSYTNEAVSGLGLPVTYSIVAGSSYATINANTGEVTFKKSELLNESFPLTITVMARTAEWNTYPAESVTYNIQLAKTSWIFNDNDLWATTGSGLTGNWSGPSTYTGNYRDGTSFYGLTKMANGEALTTDGTNELPETKGLRFTTDASSSRLGIATKDLSPNYLAVVNTNIFIDNVQAGQTVTVDWYATRSGARMSITDANGETTGDQAQGVVTLTTTTTGTVQLTFGSYASYIRSIKISTPIRATGTLTYNKTFLNPNETVNRTGYTITDEASGANIKDAYHGPETFKSSNTDVVTVDGSGNVTAVGVGVAFITATASPKNSTTHQPVTLTTMIEVVNAGEMLSTNTRTRTISVEKLLYDIGTDGKSANNGGLDRTVPGFTLTFTGGQGVKCNNIERLTLRNNGSQGVMTITTRNAYAQIAKVRLTVSNLSYPSPTVSYRHFWDGEKTVTVTDGVLELGGIFSTSVSITAVTGNFDISDIKIYYQSSGDVATCLDETKVAPAFNFPAYKQHFMRIPGDGRVFENDTPTSSNPQNFRANDFTYASSNTRIATIAADGTGGRLIGSGEATITATFAETDYFAASTATYTVSNTLLPGESYDGISMTNGQFIHVTAQTSADGTTLTMENAASNLTYGTTQERRNTYVTGNASVNLRNNTTESITVYSIDVITSNVKAWLYYEGQEENFSAQVQFTGFATGPIAGFKVVDFGDINNPIDLTDAYEWADGSVFAIQGLSGYGLINPNGETTETWYSVTGDANTPASGTAERISQIRRGLKKTGSADGYSENLTASSNVTVMTFGPDNKVVWNFQNQLDNTGTSGQMGAQWTYTNPGTGREKFYQTYFTDFMPILKNGEVAKDNNVGVLVSGDMRYYCGTSGMRLNLTSVNAHMKFPVKEGMEVVVQVASSAADVINHISNAKNVAPPYASTSDLYIEREGVNSPINAYYLAATDGSMTFDAGDKVGIYVKSITLQVPELHFTEEIVTEQAGDASRKVNYKPYNAIEGHTLNYWVKDNWNHYLDDTGADVGYVATIPNADRTTGDVTLTGSGHEGWVTIYVEDPSATGVQPKKGEYKLYVVNFQFANPSYDIYLDGTTGEAYFTERPVGYDKVKTPIEYTMALGTDNPRGRIIQYTNENPALTTYTMTAYSTGTVTVTATSGNATTSCVVNVGGLSFGDVAPVMSENDLKSSSNTFTNPWPTGWSSSDSYTYSISRSAYSDAVTCDAIPTPTAEGLKLTGLGGHGAIRVVATNNTRGETARFVLTLSYPASSRKRWSFFRAKDHNNEWGLEIGTIADYVSYNSVGASATGIAKTVNGYNGTNNSDTWTTNSSWTEVFRKGAELPRWGNDRSMKGDNAFYVQETAGLQIETGNRGFYVDQPARDPNDKYAYNHIGLHNNASITIPKLKEGDYVSLNLSRVIPNNGAILKGHNVTDLRGKNVDQSFTITRSQTEWSGLNDDGSRFIPGYYTFIAHAQGSDAGKSEFDVSFELVDEGYLDVLSIEIYDGGFYKHTMTDIKLKDQDVDAPNLILKEEYEVRELLLSYCHPMWSTSTGPCEYVFKGEQVDEAETYTPTEARYWVDADMTQKLEDDRKNLDLKLDHVKWFSERGVEYEDGRLTLKDSYGKVVLRMNNYTVEGRYLIGYTPDYVLNVGVIPHQDYPHTWNFTNISGGEVKGQAANVYNSIKSDNSNWIGLAGVDKVYELNTDYRGASLYVPGGELVSTDRMLGQRGETTTRPRRGYDELNGLGVAGKVMFPVSPVEASARQGKVAPRRAAADHNLLSYSITGTGISANTDLTAGNGTIYFGAASKFESSTISSTGYAYRCDGGDTKYVLLKPSRALKAGDVISIKAYSANDNGGLAFWTDRTSATGTKRLLSLSVSQANQEETLEYTVIVGDGVEGLTQFYVYNSGTTTLFDGVTITESYKPETMGYNLYTVTETTLTIPDLNADGKQDWIYISADAAPTTITNATAVTESNDPDGPDANPLPDASNTDNQVWKYKVTSPGASYVTFSEGTNIYQIGVTHILKEIHPVGGTGWATESRDHAIDHSLTGYFTANDVDAFKVSYDSYDMNTATVALTPVVEDKGIPANTGMVLRELDATNLTKANQGKLVPLFYPAVSTALVGDMAFSTTGNMMKPNVTKTVHTTETESVGDDEYQKFLLTNVHWTYSTESTWTHNSDDTYSESATADWGDKITQTDAAGFYRMHIWGDDVRDAMPDNSAYLLAPTDKLPIAVWNQAAATSSGVRQGTLAIRNLMEEATGIANVNTDADDNHTPGSFEHGCWYTLSGMKLDGKPGKSGLYLFNGKKVMVK